MNRIGVGVVGSGGIGLAYAAWILHGGHQVAIWSPRGGSAEMLRHEPLRATGTLEVTHQVEYADSARELAARVDVVLIAVPVNAHRVVMDALLPHLRSGQVVIVSSMASLSSLYLCEGALSRGISITVASFGSTVLTARRKSPTHVNVMSRRASLGVSCLPRSGTLKALAVCEALFGGGFTAEENPLVSTLANTNAIAHAPLALFNWTRIERHENWPQYHYLTPQVAAVIERLDGERLAIAGAFGLSLRSIERHFSQSFNIETERLADIAAELHKRRGGPPGPTDVHTRYLSEDVPYGLVFLLALGRVAQVPAPATEATIAMAGLIVGEDFAVGNDLIPALGLFSESVDGLLSRVHIEDFPGQH